MSFSLTTPTHTNYVFKGPSVLYFHKYPTNSRREGRVPSSLSYISSDNLINSHRFHLHLSSSSVKPSTSVGLHTIRLFIIIYRSLRTVTTWSDNCSIFGIHPTSLPPDPPYLHQSYSNPQSITIEMATVTAMSTVRQVFQPQSILKLGNLTSFKTCQTGKSGCF